MGRGRYRAQGGADRARGRAVRHHDRGQSGRDDDRPALDETEPRHMIEATRTAAIDLRARPSWRTVKNNLMIGRMMAALVLVASPLIAILWAVIERGAGGTFRDF